MRKVRYASVLVLLFAGLLAQCTSEGPDADPVARNAAGPVRRITRDHPTFGATSLPAIPSGAEALHWPSLAQPLLPLAGTANAGDDAVLRAALLALSEHPDWDGTAPLVAFVAKHKSSRWLPAVALSLGDVAYQVGRFSQALSFWQRAWVLAKDDASDWGTALANQAIAEYAKMNARVGRQDEVRRVLTEVEGRTFQGDAAITLDSAREGLWAMERKPGIAFRCGPLALTSVLEALEPESADRAQPFLSKVHSPPQGFSLTEVAQMAPELGLRLQRVFRRPGAPLVVPAVVHWQVGHFAAIVETRAGRYRVKDPTFGNETWMTTDAIDAESSGYFLIPKGPLHAGYRPVDEREGSGAMGKGQSGMTDPDETGPEDDSNGGDTEDCAMATYKFHTLLASLSVSDTPVRYAMARGPEVAFKVTYNQREAGQPIAPQTTGFGPNWVSTWTSYLEDNPAAPSANVKLRQRGGGGGVFSSYSALTQTFALHGESASLLRRLTAHTYVREYANGAKDFYEHSIGTKGPMRRVFLSRVVDAQGNQVALHYDPTLPTRLLSIVDAVGLTTSLFYEHAGAPFLVTKIEDPFGRAAIFSYADVAGATRLASIEDAFQIVSSFGYDAAGGMTRLTTPYGTTTFARSPLKIARSHALIRSIEATDPQGNKERIEYNLDARQTGVSRVSGAPGELLPDSGRVKFATSDLDNRNSFYWGKQQMRAAPGDYRAAHLYHWVQPNSTDVAMSILESEKPPLEGRIWYNYPGQAAPHIQGTLARPSVVGRVVVDAAGARHTQATTFAYNTLGNLTRFVDPLGRETEVLYATNEIDVVEVRQKAGLQGGQAVWQTLRRMTYDPEAAHRPGSITDAAGQTTRYEYDQHGQLARVVNPLGEVIQYTYETDPALAGFGKVVAITGDVRNGDLHFTYDALDRIQRVTSSEGYVMQYTYDALDRVRRIAYPDGSFEQFEHENQRLVAQRDRTGRFTRHRYDAMRRRVSTRDAEGRLTQFEWCSCGGLRKLIDPNGNATQWMRDLQGRVTTRRFADGRELRYGYDYSGRIVSVLDALGRTTTYDYTLDDKLATVDYEEASTADLAYTYDPFFDRVVSRRDGAGLTTHSYHPFDGVTPGAGELAFVDGPLPNDTLKYTYDALARLKKMEIVDDATRSVASLTEDFAFDARGRITSGTDDLGVSRYAYVGKSDRLDNVELPTGARTEYRYFDAAGDHLLKQVRNLASKPSGALISQFDYHYNPDRTLATWSSRQQAFGPSTWSFTYDDAQRLTGAQKRDVGQTVTAEAQYAYDGAGNRILVADASGSRTYDVNAVNQLVEQRGFGPTVFTGTIDEPARVMINGLPATVRSDGGTPPYRFDGWVDLTEGDNSVTVEAVDGNGNTATRSYVVTAGGVTTRYEYDENGNLRFERAADGSARREYRWDQANRLLALVQGSHESRFAYDGLSRRVGIRELEKGSEVSSSTFVWCEGRPCQERDARGAVVRRLYLAHGFKAGAAKHFYTRDHLDSVRELVGTDGATVEAQYSYDPWGVVERAGSNSVVSPALFTGHLVHEPSGNYLTHYRVYDPRHGRWLTRDPIGETGGMHLYGYVESNPINFIDPSGLADIFFGFEGDLVGGPLGGESAFGIVFDTDHPLESGIFRTGGPAAGANVGVSVCGGAVVRDIEGYGSDIDANIGMWSPSVIFDDQGVNGASIGYGPGVGVSIAQGYTTTTTAQDAINTVVGWFQ